MFGEGFKKPRTSVPERPGGEDPQQEMLRRSAFLRGVLAGAIAAAVGTAHDAEAKETKRTPPPATRPQTRKSTKPKHQPSPAERQKEMARREAIQIAELNKIKDELEKDIKEVSGTIKAMLAEMEKDFIGNTSEHARMRQIHLDHAVALTFVSQIHNLTENFDTTLQSFDGALTQKDFALAETELQNLKKMSEDVILFQKSVMDNEFMKQYMRSKALREV